VTPAFFFDGAGNRVSKADVQAIESGIGLLRRQGAMRVLKAYDTMSPKHRDLFRTIAELFARMKYILACSPMAQSEIMAGSMSWF
jgi:hypothetical protein